MLLLFCSQVLGTRQLIPTAQVNDISSTENGLTRKTFSNCNPWISSGWCDWHWTNAGRTRNLHDRSGSGDVKETQLTSVGRYIHPDQLRHRSIIWDWFHDKLIYEKLLKIFLCEAWSLHFFLFSPFISFYKSMQYYCNPKVETRGLLQYGLA